MIGILLASSIFIGVVLMFGFVFSAHPFFQFGTVKTDAAVFLDVRDDVPAYHFIDIAFFVACEPGGIFDLYQFGLGLFFRLDQDLFL